MMAWAYATAGHRSALLYDALADTARVRGVRDFKPQAIANTAWAFAYAGHASVRSDELFARLAAPDGSAGGGRLALSRAGCTLNACACSPQA